MNEQGHDLDPAELQQIIEDSQAVITRAEEVSERIRQSLEKSQAVRRIAVPALIRAGLVHPDTPYDR
jgi:hypothetical protein